MTTAALLAFTLTVSVSFLAGAAFGVWLADGE